jgi:hypothetical protein
MSQFVDPDLVRDAYLCAKANRQDEAPMPATSSKYEELRVAQAV